MSIIFISAFGEAVIRSNSGAEFAVNLVREWLGRIGVKTLYLEPGSPWDNGCHKSFSGKLWNELLNGEIFYTMREAEILTDRWREHYNTFRPHSSPSYQSPAPKAVLHARSPT